MSSFTRYEPRPLAFLEVRTVRGFRLKCYSIRHGERPLDLETFEAGLKRAEDELPTPPINAERPGVGFVIMHQGRTGDYLILCWWDRENELPLRVFIRDRDGWRAAAGGESVCVWDLRVIWWEREAYVSTVLAGGAVEAYLAARVSGYA